MKRIIMTLMMLMCLLNISAQVVAVYSSDANGKPTGACLFTTRDNVKVVVTKTADSQSSKFFNIYKVDADGNAVGAPLYSTNERVQAIYAQKDIEINAADYVDLGLRVNWATKNIGANEPSDIGSYFMWGMVEEDATCSWSTYHLGNNQNDITKYNDEDGRTVLVREDDAANKLLGDSWRIPTTDQINELITGCNWTWSTMGGTSGYKVSSKTDATKYIFLPVTGGKAGTAVGEAEKGYYWTKNLVMDDLYYNAYALSFTSSGKEVVEKMRNLGFCIRPVRAK